MKEFSIKVLNDEHGKKVLEFFKSIGVDVGGYIGNVTEANGGRAIFYGVIDGKFANRSISNVRDILTLEEAERTFNKKVTTKSMKLVKTKSITINGVERLVTLAVLVNEENQVKTGYSVCMPEDTPDPELAEKIAVGRALKEKTNLTPDVALGKGTKEKYILHAIADHQFKVLADGKTIKGIK